MILNLRRSVAALAATGLLVVAGCSGDGEPENNTDSAEGVTDEVTYLTGFGTFGREAYAYVALDKGYFEDEGIDVTIQPGTGTADAVTHASSGQAEFALADMSGALIQWGQGHQDFTVVAAVQQRTLIGIMTLAENEITAPGDLEGATVADAPASVGVLLWETYASLAGVDPEAVEFQDASPPQLPQLLASGSVDGIGQFVVGQPTIENVAEGREAHFLPYSDYLTDLYGISLITSSSLAEEDPELVQRFLSALLRGLEYTLDNPDEAGEILASHEEGQDPEVAAAELRLMDPYVREGNTPLGNIDEVRLGQSIALLEGAGAMPEGTTPEDVASFDLVPTGTEG